MTKQVKRIAETIREAYIAERTKAEQLRLGGARTYKPGKHWDGDGKRKPIWESLARTFIARGVEAKTFVRHAFSILRACGRVPMPNQLAGDALYEVFKEWEPKYGEQIKIAFHTQQACARSHLAYLGELEELSKDEIWNLMLFDETLPMTALFRYCLAKSEGYKKAARTYREAALAEYMTSPTNYDEQWKEWIPSQLKQDAAELAKAARRRSKE